MVHAAVHWPNNRANNIRLWPFAVEHVVWLFDQIKWLAWLLLKSLPRPSLITVTCVGPMSGVVQPLCWIHFQDGKKIPKWNRRSCEAQCVEYSSNHSSPKVRHLQKNHVSPRFHLIHNNNFETILLDSPLDHLLAYKTIEELLDISHKVYCKIERSLDGAVVYQLPPLDDIWIDKIEPWAKYI
jgi:hypothetical protein